MRALYLVTPPIALTSVAVVLGVLGFRVNLTSSLPFGVYRITSEEPRRGSLVHICLPRDVAGFARERGYLGPGVCPGGVRPLGKAVIAAPGDVVALNRDEICVNGRAVPNSATQSEDSRGRQMPHFPWGAHQLERDEFWLFSPYPSAYDSRYFGPVTLPQVGTVLEPLWTGASHFPLAAWPSAIGSRKDDR